MILAILDGVGIVSAGNFSSSVFANPPLLFMGKRYDHSVPDTFSPILLIFAPVLFFGLF